MKRAILLIRISSLRQEAVNQTNELREFARRDGYKEDEIYEISNVESAIKLSDEQRQGLTEMKNIIENSDGQIETVYIWELSRLSRKPDTLLYYRGYFEEKGVDLRFMKPFEFRLLDVNKKVNSMAKMIYGNFVTWCENEIEMRKERFERSKRGNALSGKSNGGNLRYGYKLDSNGKFEINLSEATIIQTIYEKYSTGKYSVLTLMRDLRDNGIVLTHSRIASILKFKGYTGEPYIEQHIGKNYYERVYPQIVSIKQYEQCAAIAEKNNTYKDKSRKSIYYAAKLIKCSSCGHYLTPNRSSKHKSYMCVHKSLERLHTACQGGTSIRINVIDSIAWYFARNIEIHNLMNINKTKLNELQEKIEELKKQNDSSEKQFEGIKNKKRASLKRILSTQNDSAIEQLVIDETKIEWNRIQNDILNRNVEIRHNEKLIAEGQRGFDLYNTVLNKSSLSDELDRFSDIQKYEIVHKHIREIRITEVEDVTTPTKRIDIHYFENNKFDTIYYCSKIKDVSRKLYEHKYTDSIQIQRFISWNDIYIDRFPI
jgi:DNA invertase Pin-like site-specific DNA recombinase/ribosomal protein L32